MRKLIMIFVWRLRAGLITSAALEMVRQEKYLCELPDV